MFGNKEDGRGGPEVRFTRELLLAGAGLLHEQLCLSSAASQVKTGVFRNFGPMHRKPSGSPKVCHVKHKIFHSTTSEMTGKVICTLNSSLELA